MNKSNYLLLNIGFFLQLVNVYIGLGVVNKARFGSSEDCQWEDRLLREGAFNTPS